MNNPRPTTPAGVALPSDNRLGQGTAIEQSRAVAEVQAAILVAQNCPRNVASAIAEMEESCRQKELAERAFYAFPRSGATVTGPSVYLARELARCWGNIQFGVAELRRDDQFGQSEMQAYAWDLERNTRNATIFIVPHKRDKKGGPERLVDMRDIYENNANNGARRVREAIFAVLPPWFVERAKTLCHQTLKSGGGEPLAQRIAGLIKAFGEIGISEDQLERKVGRKVGKWTEDDYAQLRVIGGSLKKNEITRDDAFPPVRVTSAEISGTQQADDDPDALWRQVLATAPTEWDERQVEAHFMEATGVDSGRATAADMRRYLEQVAR